MAAADIAVMSDDVAKMVVARAITTGLSHNLDNPFGGLCVVHVLGITTALMDLTCPV